MTIVYIDINGQNKPNTYGKDIFRFLYIMYYGSPTHSLNGKFIPGGGNMNVIALIADGDESNCNKNAAGLYCAGLIMKQGWQITDDYPWN
jgi:hypothetical protein